MYLVIYLLFISLRNRTSNPTKEHALLIGEENYYQYSMERIQFHTPNAAEGATSFVTEGCMSMTKSGLACVYCV